MIPIYPKSLENIAPELAEIDRKISKVKTYRNSSSNHKEFTFYNKMVCTYKIEKYNITLNFLKNERKQSA